MRRRITSCGFCPIVEVPVDRTRIAVEDTQRGARLNHTYTRKLPIREQVPCGPLQRRKLRRGPSETRHHSLVPVIAGQTVRGLPKNGWVVVVGWQLQLKGVGSTLSVDFIQVLRPYIASLKLEPMLHPPRNAGLQRVVVRDEDRPCE